ncbi:MAG: P1 family peptidase [Clostridia bacterium]|nr:P1 family peptidase [Clostridia bacterium]
MKVTIPSGFKIGHYDDEYTGVTVILSKGAVAGCDCRGGGPGTRETDLLRPEKAMQKINAVVLTGGSAYGLASTVGVMEYLQKNGIGYKVGNKVVPIVTGAVIYDLNQKEYHYPTAEYGFKACENAGKTLEFGNIGVGKGATVGKIRGIKYASKSGVGAASVKVAGVTVTAVVAVNALGDVVDPETNKIIAGAKGKNGEFIDTEKCLSDGEFLKLLLGTNTTIGCILTDAKLDKVGANKLASIAHNGLARTIRPVHTDYDGDTLFVMSSDKKPVVNFAVLQSAVVKATMQAVVNAVTLTKDYEVICEEETEE